jgi:coiled-coil domain-containing protein 55
MSNSGGSHPQSIKLQYGLNKPGGGSGGGGGASAKGTAGSDPNAIKKKKGPLSTKNVLMGSDDDDDDSDHSGNDKGGNTALLAHQDALRQRAERALQQAKAQGDDVLYDYDGAYDSFSSEAKAKAKEEHESSSANNTKPKSKYITGLLKNAEKRQHILENIREKQNAKQLKQEEEENEALYGQKEKFVTKSYKRKLQERQRWVEEEEAQEKRDKEHKGGLGNAREGFSLGASSMVRNVVVNGGDYNNAEEAHESKKSQPDGKQPAAPSWMDGFAAAPNDDVQQSGPPTLGKGAVEQAESKNSRPHEADADLKEDDATRNKRQRLAVLRQRDKKLSTLREEYFGRMKERGLSHLLSMD